MGELYPQEARSHLGKAAWPREFYGDILFAETESLSHWVGLFFGLSPDLLFFLFFSFFLLFFFFYSFLFFFFLAFLSQHLKHVEVPRLGVPVELQPPAYITATATWDPSRFCDLHHSSQ